MKIFKFKKNIIFQLRSRHNGFSLVEAVLYLAIVAILLTAVVNFHLVLGGTADKLSANIEISQNSRVALGAISYLIENSDGLLKDVNGSCSDLATTSAPVLGLYFSSDTYLPGTCVQNGGGVMLTVSSTRVLMTCYPNITNNGQFQACDPTSFGNSYYLTSPNVMVRNSDLSFTTSTATSTGNNFASITTGLTVQVVSQGQASLKAESSATSTVLVRNEQDDGLIAWYKFDDSDSATAIDSVNNFHLTCDDAGAPTAVSGLVDGSSGAFDFNVAGGNYCYLDDEDDYFDFSNAFTIATWLKMDAVGATDNDIINKAAGSPYLQGYRLYNYYSGSGSGRVIFKICDTTACTNVIDVSSLIVNSTIYHLTIIYDLDNDIAKLYAYQKGVSGTNTTTASSIPILVNYDAIDIPRVGLNMDGTMDALNIYKRALSDEEIWALQSQGAN
ncbi:prepilin-type N-terminal cleavage/methylation domain-containing protein [bacterium]|nr:prepilin-type N-terminal cleavage/methylation domain-containing protein [bacterium]